MVKKNKTPKNEKKLIRIKFKTRRNSNKYSSAKIPFTKPQ
jgi:hypothetical protein